MSFLPDIPGAEIIPSKSFWAGRKAEWPVSGVVQHYTASASEGGLVKWMGTPESKNSAHVFIFRNGHVVQMVSFADRAFHAGEKQGKGFWPRGISQPTNVNQFTIGIENCNVGWLLQSGNDFYLPAKTTAGFVPGRKYSGPKPERAADHFGVMRYWEPYSDKLVAANIEVLKRIVDSYPIIQAKDICFHSDVSPHRKSDPGPLWPHDYVLNEVFGTEEMIPPALADADDPDDDDDEIASLGDSRGDNAEAEENPEWHYDYDEQMSMIERVIKPSE